MLKNHSFYSFCKVPACKSVWKFPKEQERKVYILSMIKERFRIFEHPSDFRETVKGQKVVIFRKFSSQLSIAASLCHSKIDKIHFWHLYSLSLISTMSVEFSVTLNELNTVLDVCTTSGVTMCLQCVTQCHTCSTCHRRQHRRPLTAILDHLSTHTVAKTSQ